MGKRNPPRLLVDYLHMGAMPVYVGVVFDALTFAAELRRLGVAEPPNFVSEGKDAQVHTLFKRDASNVRGTTMIVAVRFPVPAVVTPVQVAALLVHEAVHVWQIVVNEIGEHGTFQSVCENEAYQVQWISQFLMDKYAERVNGATR